MAYIEMFSLVVIAFRKDSMNISHIPYSQIYFLFSFKVILSQYKNIENERQKYISHNYTTEYEYH